MAGHDEIDDLAERTGEYVYLVAEERGREVTLSESRGDYAIATDYHLRLRETLQYRHHNAAGKAMLAHVDADRRDRIRDARKLEAQTANTITDETKVGNRSRQCERTTMRSPTKRKSVACMRSVYRSGFQTTPSSVQ